MNWSYHKWNQGRKTWKTVRLNYTLKSIWIQRIGKNKRSTQRQINLDNLSFIGTILIYLKKNRPSINWSNFLYPTSGERSYKVNPYPLPPLKTGLLSTGYPLLYLFDLCSQPCDLKKVNGVSQTTRSLKRQNKCNKWNDHKSVID